MALSNSNATAALESASPFTPKLLRSKFLKP
jgi:hypothetical protein